MPVYKISGNVVEYYGITMHIEAADEEHAKDIFENAYNNPNFYRAGGTKEYVDQVSIESFEPVKCNYLEIKNSNMLYQFMNLGFHEYFIRKISKEDPNYEYSYHIRITCTPDRVLDSYPTSIYEYETGKVTDADILIVNEAGDVHLDWNANVNTFGDIVSEIHSAMLDGRFYMDCNTKNGLLMKKRIRKKV